MAGRNLIQRQEGIISPAYGCELIESGMKAHNTEIRCPREFLTKLKISKTSTNRINTRIGIYLPFVWQNIRTCLLYTSDAADE